MSRSGNLGKAARLELYRVALTNAKTNAKIAELFAKNGIPIEILDEGTRLLDIAREKNAIAELARKKRSEAYKVYQKKRAVIDEIFKELRAKSNMLFIYDENAQQQLELRNRVESSYVKWIGQVRKFFTVLSEKQEIAGKLATVGFSAEDTEAMHTHIKEIGEMRANYINEKGNAQNATDAKTVAIRNLSTWMGKFFALAKSTLRQQPQLMESFDIVVRS